MARYYFGFIERDGQRTRDEEGLEVLDDATAVNHAREFARELAGDFVKEGELIDGQRIEVIKNGKLVAAVYLRNEIRIAPIH